MSNPKFFSMFSMLREGVGNDSDQGYSKILLVLKTYIHKKNLIFVQLPVMCFWIGDVMPGQHRSMQQFLSPPAVSHPLSVSPIAHQQCIRKCRLFVRILFGIFKLAALLKSPPPVCKFAVCAVVMSEKFFYFHKNSQK